MWRESVSGDVVLQSNPLEGLEFGSGVDRSAGMPTTRTACRRRYHRRCGSCAICTAARGLAGAWRRARCPSDSRPGSRSRPKSAVRSIVGLLVITWRTFWPLGRASARSRWGSVSVPQGIYLVPVLRAMVPTYSMPLGEDGEAMADQVCLCSQRRPGRYQPQLAVNGSPASAVGAGLMLDNELHGNSWR